MPQITSKIFDKLEITLLSKTKTVYIGGEGPAVIVMSEMPGIYSKVIDFARRLRDAGFTVWMPHMFGQVGREPSMGYLYSSMARACISREFYAFSSNQTSPIVDWLKAMAAHAFPLCGGEGVGAIGSMEEFSRSRIAAAIAKHCNLARPTILF